MESAKEPTLQLLSGSDFSPEKYVRNLSQNCVGGPELRRLRKKIHNLSENTNTNLKLNVYQNYMQFIDTAKEISNLESEMYQLSHLLSEQKSLLVALSNTSILGDRIEFNTTRSSGREVRDKTKLKMQSILEKVEGCKDIVNMPGRAYLHDGDLLEVDPLDGTPRQPIHAYLFTDAFMTCVKNASNSLMKYTCDAIYELGSLAVVNVRDLGGATKHQFKLLIFPDSRVFQCSSSSVKKEWLDQCDQAKKNRLNLDQQPKSIVDTKPEASPVILQRQDSIPILAEHPTWFLEVAEDLDVCVAQRHFEDAVNLLEKAEVYISNAQDSGDHVIIDMQRKLDQRHLALTEVLMRELELGPNKSLQGGLRSARRAVRLLNQLGHSQQACELFLKLCSGTLRVQCKRVKREGSATIYIRRLSSVVFTNMCFMTEEFLRAFPVPTNCTSAYVVWASGELSAFTNHFVKQVFMQQTSLSTLAECIVIVRSQCERLCNFGIDLGYQLDGALLSPVTQALRDAADKAIDAVKLRSLEDRWRPTNLKTKLNLGRMVQEYTEWGVKLETFITGDTWLQLTANTLAFTKLYFCLLNDCLKLTSDELQYVIDDILYVVLEAQIRHCETALRTESNSDQRQFIIKNAEFLMVTVHDLVQMRYQSITGSVCCETLQKLGIEYKALLKGISPSVRSTKTKYSSSEFL